MGMDEPQPPQARSFSEAISRKVGDPNSQRSPDHCIADISSPVDEDPDLALNFPG